METNKIESNYFFGGSGHGGRVFDRYYEARIDGIRVEKHANNKGVKFSIGNIDDAKIKYKSEGDLIKAVNEKRNEL